MAHQEITNGLKQLGFNSGWVVSGDEITVWENEAAQPTAAAIATAATLWAATQAAEAEANATAKAALLARLGITADEATLLLS
jgi:MOSC domain-containing protein YiiM